MASRDSCEAYWAHTDYLPIDVVVSYWCQKSGHSDSHCREAKQAAICKAVDDKIINHRRSDGATFRDPAHELAHRQLLQIERTSFDAWAEQFGDDAKLPVSAAAETRSRTTLLRLVYVMAVKGYAYDPGSIRSDVTQSICDDAAECGVPIDQGTVRKWLREAAATCQEPAPKANSGPAWLNSAKPK